jgi:class 3 adenylate cyclase
MPIYMDRHTMENATAQAVADAHTKDLRLQDKYGVKLLTYWFDEERGSAFCLVDAPEKDRVSALHADAHGSIPNKIIEVDPQTVELFLGRIEDPARPAESDPTAADTPIDPAFRVIMFTDMKDSTAITTELGDAGALIHFRTHNAISRDLLRQHGGREIQHTGDGFMASFTSATHAVNCAVAMQRAFAAHNQQHADTPINVRIGMCAGEPVEEDHRLFGSTVQLTARICSACKPDQILVAPVIRDLCMGKQFSFVDKGTTLFKGFTEPQQLFEVVWREARVSRPGIR